MRESHSHSLLICFKSGKEERVNVNDMECYQLKDIFATESKDKIAISTITFDIKEIEYMKCNGLCQMLSSVRKFKKVSDSNTHAV